MLCILKTCNTLDTDNGPQMKFLLVKWGSGGLPGLQLTQAREISFINDNKKGEVFF